MFKKDKEIPANEQEHVQQMTVAKYLLMNKSFKEIAEAVNAAQK